MTRIHYAYGLGVWTRRMDYVYALRRDGLVVRASPQD